MTRLGAFILIAFVAAGCGGSPSNPAAPGSGTAGAGNVSAFATTYLNEVLGLMQTNSINRARINWTDFRAQVFQRAQGAQHHRYLPGDFSRAGLLEFQNGAASSGGSVIARTSAVYELMTRDPKVAVLTDGRAASSSEAVVISFRRRPNTRSFGGATCGLSTSNSTFRLSDGAMLLLTTTVMVDRTQSPYGDVIAPDEAIAGDSPVVERAVAWLRGI